MSHLFKIYVTWALIVGGAFIALTFVITATPLGRIFGPRPPRRLDD